MKLSTYRSLRYLTNSHHIIAETKKWTSEPQLGDGQFLTKVNLNIYNPITTDIAHRSTLLVFEMFVDPYVPCDSPIFVIHKINALIHWINTIKNQLYYFSPSEPSTHLYYIIVPTSYFFSHNS